MFKLFGLNTLGIVAGFILNLLIQSKLPNNNDFILFGLNVGIIGTLTSQIPIMKLKHAFIIGLLTMSITAIVIPIIRNYVY